MTLDEALDQIEEQERDLEERDQEGYTLEASIIKEAWAQYRRHLMELQNADQSEILSSKQDIKSKDKDEDDAKDPNSFFTVKFVNKLFANMHLQIYNYDENEDQKQRKQQFKSFVNYYKEKILQRKIKKQMNKQQGDDDHKQEDNSEDDDPCHGFNDEEIQLIDDFLESFILQNDSGSKVD